MEYILFINSKIEFYKMCNNIINILCDDDIFGEVKVMDKKEKELSLYCDLFTLNINFISDYIWTMAEESKIELNTELYMDLDMSCTEVIRKTIFFVGKCLNSFNGNAILLSNGDTPIIKRSEGKIVVDSSKIKSEVAFPFEELRVDYRLEKIQLISD